MKRPSSGFTLLEVMVALLIISTSLVYVAGSIGQAVDTANTMRERTYASWIAQNRITELRLAGVIPETGETSGEVEYANMQWSWTAEIEETGIENLFKVDVSVGFAGSDNRLHKVTGFIGEPIVPGQSNLIWNSGQSDRGERR